MSMLYEPIPTPYFNVAYNQDDSNKCTIIASNAGHSECESNIVSNEGTTATQFITDVENNSDVDDAKTGIPAGVFIPLHALP